MNDASPLPRRAGRNELSTETLRLPLAPSLERRRLQVYLLLLLVDSATIALSFVLGGYLYLGDGFDGPNMLAAQLLLPIYWTAAIARHAYSIDGALAPRKGVVRALTALALATAFLIFLGFFLKTNQAFSRVALGVSTLLAAGGLAIARDLTGKFARHHCGPTGINCVVIDDGGRPIDVLHACRLDAKAHGLIPDIADPHALNRIGMFMRNMDRVIVSCGPERRRAWAWVLKGVNVQSEIVDDDILALGAVGARRSDGYAALIIAVGPLRLTNRLLKRALDLAVAVSVLLALSPLLLAVAVAIKLEDGGPVLFVQRRLGRGNRFFTILKFRSMRSDGGEGEASTARGDARITRVGSLIRATSIDELPQLFNVIAGQMSLVGPRPHALGSQAGAKLFWEVDDRYWQRHVLKPGLTGLAQIRGLRGATDREEDLAHRLQADLEYLEGWTIWRDLTILLATFRVLVHRNAF